MASGPRFYAPFYTQFDAAGVTVPRALLNFYLTESDTRTPTYADQALTVENTNPVEALDNGVFPSIFIDPTITYKVVATYPDDGITEPVEFWTADPYKLPWPAGVFDYFDQPFQFLGGAPPLTHEIMGIYTAIRPQRIFGNFDGTGLGYKKAWGNWLTAPAAEVIVDAYLNNTGGVRVGYMRIAAATGATDFFTGGGLPIDLDSGECLIWRGPLVAPTLLADGSWTIPGYNL